nr:hypothetical protein [Candidatus Sigynarchaeota archaeon]
MEREELTGRRNSEESYFDPCGACCGLLILICVVAWALTVNPVLTAVILGTIAILILVYVGNKISKREIGQRVERRRITPSREPTPQRLKPPGTEPSRTVRVRVEGRCVFCGGSFPTELDICPDNPAAIPHQKLK